MDELEEYLEDLAQWRARGDSAFQVRPIRFVIGADICTLMPWEAQLVLKELRALPRDLHPETVGMADAVVAALYGSEARFVAGQRRVLLRAVESIRQRRRQQLPVGLRELRAALLRAGQPACVLDR